MLGPLERRGGTFHVCTDGHHKCLTVCHIGGVEWVQNWSEKHAYIFTVSKMIHLLQVNLGYLS